MKNKKSILLIVLFLIPINFFNFSPISSTSNTNNNEKYLIIKVDDVGDNLILWKWFYNAIMSDKNVNVDLGVIARRMQYSPEHENYFKNYIINNPQFGIFNHGWDHNIPEFENRSYDYMYTHISYWDYYMKTVFSYVPEVKVLGAPGNSIGNRSDCSLDLYTILAQLHYKLLFFSTCSLSQSNGMVGGDLRYIEFENSHLKPRPLNDIIHDFDLLKNDRFVFTQIHPALYWNSSYLLYILNNVLTITKRTTIHIQDYYENYFLKEYPNYFLQRPSNFLKHRSDIQNVKISSYEYDNSLRPDPIYYVMNVLISLSDNFFIYIIPLYFNFKRNPFNINIYIQIASDIFSLGLYILSKIRRNSLF